MAAIGAGVGEHLHIKRCQRAVLARANLHSSGHLVSRRGADEFLLAAPFPLHRATQFHRGEQHKIFRNQFLFAAETSPDALGEHMQVAWRNPHDVGELLPRGERRLRTRADMPTAILTLPGDRSMRLEMHMLHAGGRVGLLVHHIGFLEALGDITDFTLQRAEDVVAGGHQVFVMQQRCARLHRQYRIEYGRQDLVFHVQRPAAGLGRCLRLRHHGCDPLAYEARDVVEQRDVIGVDEMVLVQRRTE
jgi:hypothetical protein